MASDSPKLEIGFKLAVLRFKHNGMIRAMTLSNPLWIDSQNLIVSIVQDESIDLNTRTGIYRRYQDLLHMAQLELDVEYLSDLAKFIALLKQMGIPVKQEESRLGILKTNLESYRKKLAWMVKQPLTATFPKKDSDDFLDLGKDLSNNFNDLWNLVEHQIVAILATLGHDVPDNVKRLVDILTSEP